MKSNISEFPKHPVHDAPLPAAQPPTVFVYEKMTWQYKVITKGAGENPLTEDELNALGKDGWELVAAIPHATRTEFYLKRSRS